MYTYSKSIGQVSSQVTTNTDLKNHSDLNGLLWITNSDSNTFLHSIKVNDSNSTGKKLLLNIKNEPSLILTNLPIKLDANSSMVENPPYYPLYSELTADQRAIYIRFLEDPYTGQFDIGYVFLLYYGLERHLLLGDIDKAFRVIMKLRKVYDKSSFQTYSSRAIAVSCMLRQRADLAVEFFNVMNHQMKPVFFHEIYLLCKYALEIPLYPLDLMRMSKLFGLKSETYTKKHPKMFLDTLSKIMYESYGVTYLTITDLISKNELKQLPQKVMLPLFGNLSLKDVALEALANMGYAKASSYRGSFEIPMINKCEKIESTVYQLLKQAHEAVKMELANMCKNGIAPSEEIVQRKKSKVLSTFDYQKEDDLINNYKIASNVIEKYYALQAMCNLYYKFRNEDLQYEKKCIDCCYKIIELLPQVQYEHIQNEQNRIKGLSKYAIYSEEQISEKLKSIRSFIGGQEAFRHLVAIYEKEKNYNSEWDICNQAITYFSDFNMDYMIDFFKQRKEKIKKHIEK